MQIVRIFLKWILVTWHICKLMNGWMKYVVDVLYSVMCFFPLNTKALAELQVQILCLLEIPPAGHNYMDLNGTWLI